jgi:choice-of-anchor A domain-containing protein
MHAAGSVRTQATAAIPVDMSWATEASAVWATTAATAPVVVIDASTNNRTLRFQGDSNTVNVFTVTAASLATTRATQLRIPTGAIAVINVTGNSFSSTGSNSGGLWNGTAYTNYSANSTNATALAYRTHVVWNFPTATSIDVNGFTLEGTMLAPKAAVATSGARINGSMFVDSLTSAGTSSAFSTALRCAALPVGGEVADVPEPTTTTTAAPTTTTTVAPTTTTTVAPTTAAPTTTVAPTTTTTVAPIVIAPYTADQTNADCNDDVWHYVVSKLGVDPASISTPTALLVWSDGSQEVVSRTIVGTEAIYQTASRSGLTVASASINLPVGLSFTFTLVEGGKCPPVAPVLLVCYEGDVGTPATEGRYGYRATSVVSPTGITLNTVSVAGFIAPFDAILRDDLSVVYSVPFTLQGAPLTWDFDGVYDDGGDFNATSVALAAAGVVVTTDNGCPSGLLSPATRLGVCYAQSVGSAATAGRFWYQTDYVIALPRVVSNLMNPVTESRPFTSLNSAEALKVESSSFTLGSAAIVWSFDGVDAVAHRTGVLTATLQPTGHVVAVGEQCATDAAVAAAENVASRRPT